MSDKYKLDGTDKIKPVPFDAHEQVARSHHEEAPKQDGYVHSGLKAADYEASEYPKAVDHVGGEPVLANSAEEEQAYHEQKAAEGKEA